MMHFPGGVNLILILAVVLVVFGPNKMPEIARSMGKAISDFKGALREVTDHLDLNSPGHETRVYSSADHSLADGRASSYDYSTPSVYSESQYPDPHQQGTANPSPGGHPGAVPSGDQGSADSRHWETQSSVDSSHQDDGANHRSNQSMLIG